MGLDRNESVCSTQGMISCACPVLIAADAAVHDQLAALARGDAAKSGAGAMSMPAAQTRPLYESAAAIMMTHGWRQQHNEQWK